MSAARNYPDVTFVYNENVYVYAGLTWAEYWASEDVYNAGSTASSEEKDRRGESDLGAFDAVTRATANHGLHRGSFSRQSRFLMEKQFPTGAHGAENSLLCDGT